MSQRVKWPVLFQQLQAESGLVPNRKDFLRSWQAQQQARVEDRLVAIATRTRITAILFGNEAASPPAPHHRDRRTS